MNAIGKTGNAYYARELAGTRAQWDTLYEKTCEKLDQSDLKIDSFHAMDVVEWLEKVVPEEDAVMCFPPFFAGDYEQQFASLTDHLLWQEPEYPELDNERKKLLLGLIMRRKHWVIGLHIEQPQLRGYLRGLVQTTNRGVPIYVYASDGPMRVVTPRQVTEPVLAPRLQGNELGKKIAIAPLTGGQFATLRSQYMNANIVVGSPLSQYAVTIDGKVAGAFAFGSPESGFDAETVYMLSDFPVAPTEHKHLAQLIVRAATSKEARHLYQRSTGTRSLWLLTTAFTNNAESMKYRNVFGKAMKRAEAEDGRHKYMLNYYGPFGEKDLQTHYEEWKAKYEIKA